MKDFIIDAIELYEQGYKIADIAMILKSSTQMVIDAVQIYGHTNIELEETL